MAGNSYRASKAMYIKSTIFLFSRDTHTTHTPTTVPILYKYLATQLV